MEERYQAITELNTCQSYDEILAVFRTYTVAAAAQSISLGYFHNVADTSTVVPEVVDILARWSSLPHQTFRTRYTLTEFPSLGEVVSPEFVLIEDVMAESFRQKIDENLMTMYQEASARTLVSVPITVLGHWIGFIGLIYQQVMTFSATELETLSQLTQHISVAVQNLYNLQQEHEHRHYIEELVERERMVRDITQKMRQAATLPDLIRIATEELAHHLGVEQAILEIGFAEGEA